MSYICVLNTVYNMIYTKKEYCEKFGISHDTLERRVKDGNLPSFHKVKPLDGRGFVIVTDQCEVCAVTEKAVREYNLRKSLRFDAELATEIAIKYDLKVSKMFRLIGL